MYFDTRVWLVANPLNHRFQREVSGKTHVVNYSCSSYQFLAITTKRAPRGEIDRFSYSTCYFSLTPIIAGGDSVTLNVILQHQC